MEITKQTPTTPKILNAISLVVLHLILMSITGFLTLDAWANINSRFGAVLLSFFIPMFIVYKTAHLNRRDRLFRFGLGYMVYILLALIMVGLPTALGTGLVPCLMLSLGTLYYGDMLLRMEVR